MHTRIIANQYIFKSCSSLARYLSSLPGHNCFRRRRPGRSYMSRPKTYCPRRSADWREASVALQRVHSSAGGAAVYTPPVAQRRPTRRTSIGAAVITARGARGGPGRPSPRRLTRARGECDLGATPASTPQTLAQQAPRLLTSGRCREPTPLPKSTHRTAREHATVPCLTQRGKRFGQHQTDKGAGLCRQVQTSPDVPFTRQ